MCQLASSPKAHSEMKPLNTLFYYYYCQCLCYSQSNILHVWRTTKRTQYCYPQEWTSGSWFFPLPAEVPFNSWNTEDKLQFYFFNQIMHCRSYCHLTGQLILILQLTDWVLWQFNCSIIQSCRVSLTCSFPFLCHMEVNTSVRWDGILWPLHITLTVMDKNKSWQNLWGKTHTP